MNRIEKAVDILGQHITEVATVSEWADIMGYDSPKYFSRLIRNHYGKRPKELIVQVKLRKIKECFARESDEILFCMARDLGFVDNNALYKFINRHTGKTPTQLKRECKKGV